MRPPDAEEDEDHVYYELENFTFGAQPQKDGSWLDLDQLLRENLEESISKLPKLEDEIWGKLVIMQRNQRIAKAYLRNQIVIIDGSTQQFDGYRVGLRAAFRDIRAQEHQLKIGAGLRVRVNLQGDIEARREVRSGKVSLYNVRIGNDGFSQASTAEIVRKRAYLEPATATKIFDMRQFKQELELELSGARSNGWRSCCQTVVIIGFGKPTTTTQLLNAPCWCLLINLIALDMLSTKLSAPSLTSGHSMTRISATQANSSANRRICSQLPPPPKPGPAVQCSCAHCAHQQLLSPCEYYAPLSTASNATFDCHLSAAHHRHCSGLAGQCCQAAAIAGSAIDHCSRSSNGYLSDGLPILSHQKRKLRRQILASSRVSSSRLSTTPSNESIYGAGNFSLKPRVPLVHYASKKQLFRTSSPNQLSDYSDSGYTENDSCSSQPKSSTNSSAAINKSVPNRLLTNADWKAKASPAQKRATANTDKRPPTAELNDGNVTIIQI